MSALIQQTILVIFIYFLGFFTIGTLIKNNSIVDIGWGLGFVVVSWFSLPCQFILSAISYFARSKISITRQHLSLESGRVCII